MAKDLVNELSRQIVHTTSLFSVDENFEDERFMRVRLYAMHSGLNRNGSYFSKDCILDAKDTFANIPILADIQEHTDKDGNTYLDYTTHSMHIEQDAFDEDSNRIIYDEKVVGVIPESNNFELELDEETGNYYVKVDALLYREYGNYCCDILKERGGTTEVSMEINCEEVSYSAKEKYLEVGKMNACACTLLGADVKPGMAKAHAETFSINKDDRDTQLFTLMQELKESLDKYNKNCGKEEIEVDLNEEVLEEVAETTEEFVEEVTEESAEDTTVEETLSEDTEDVTPEESVEESDEEFSEDDESEVDEYSVKYSMTYGENTKEFALSLSDKIYAIQSLVNETYSDVDNDWYYCDVFEEDGYVVMHGWNRSYRQSFKCKKEKYSLVGDRVEVFAQWLTEDEIAKLDSMKTSYAEVSEKLQKYESEPQKMEILESAKYGYVSQTDEFINLKENHFDLSVDEVSKEADKILLSYAERGELKFAEQSLETVPTVTQKKFVNSDKKQSRYGNLFK